MFRISKLLYFNKEYLLKILEYQTIGIDLEIHNSRCDIEKFFLYQEKNKINELKKQINLDQINNMEINALIKKN